MDAAPVLRRLIEAVQGFYKVVDRECVRSTIGLPLSGRDAEARVIDATIALADALEAAQGLDVEGLPFACQDALEDLPRLLDALAGRWGWQGVAGPDRRAYVEERRRRFVEEVVRPFYEAALTLRQTRHPEGREWAWAAEEGRRLGYQPDTGLRAEEAARTIQELSTHHARRLLIADRFPSLDVEDIEPIRQAAKAIAGGIAPHQVDRVLAQAMEGVTESPPVEPGPGGNPVGQTVAAPPPEAVVLGPTHREPVLVRNEPKTLRTRAQYDVLRVLLKAGKAGLTRDQLVTQSGHADPVNVLVRLARDLDWASVIHFPGPGGKGYWIG